MTNSSPFELLCCPLHPESGSLIHAPSAGLLTCPQCARAFPIVDGIPDLLVTDVAHEEFLATEAEQWYGHDMMRIVNTTAPTRHQSRLRLRRSNRMPVICFLTLPAAPV